MRYVFANITICISACLSFTAHSEDFLCPVDSHPPSEVGVRNLGYVTTAANTSTKATVSEMLQHSRPLQQININDSAAQAKNAGVKLTFSLAETNRQAQSGTCDGAFDNLLRKFSENSASLGLAGTSSIYGLSAFVSWYLNPKTSEATKTLAAPVIDAERNYDSACLTSNIPNEFNPVLIKRAVGILVFAGQPFCTALRMSSTDLLTAKHCFVSEKSDLLPHTVSSLKGGEKIWFQYEDEPENRYEVCRDSLPQTSRKTKLLPFEDNIRLKTKQTARPPPEWKWSTAQPGASLYLRGYFPFAEEESLIQRMRSTAKGGCAAITVRNRCTFHACQSTPIMSGAPIFLRPDASSPQTTLEVIGIHLGTASVGNSSTCNGFDGSSLSLSNFSYLPNGDVR